MRAPRLSHLAVLILLPLVGANVANGQGLVVAFRGGTAGLGGEVTTAVTDRLRVGLSASSWALESSESITRGGVSLTQEGTLASGVVGLTVDGDIGHDFFVSLGLWSFVTGGNLTVEPIAAATLADSELGAEELGAIRVRARYPERPIPYIGLGWHRQLVGRFGLEARTGLAFVGRPTFSANATGRFAPSEAWAGHLEDAFSGQQWLPVVTVSLTAQIHAPRH